MPLATYAHFADRDPLTRVGAGADARRRLDAPLPRARRSRSASEVEPAARSTSKSAVSRDVRRAHPRAPGGADGPPARRRPPGGDDARRDRAEGPHATSSRWGSRPTASRSRSGSGTARRRTRPSRRALLADLVERGLDPEQGDPLRARRRQGAPEGDPQRVRATAPVQRCIRHKERNVLDHLPERDRPPVKQRLRRAWARDDHDRALDGCERSPPSSTAPIPAPPARCARAWRRRSRSPGSGSRGSLKRTLESTNPCESMIECVRRTSRNVKRWQSGDMACAGPPPACSKPNSSSARSSATATSPSSPSRSSTTSPHDRPVPDPGGRYPRHRLTITPGPPSRSSTTNGTSSQPRFKCYKCKAEFDEPSTRTETVESYRSRHDVAWVDLAGVLHGKELRALCLRPASQLSLRPLDWERFHARLTPPLAGNPLGHLTIRARQLAGGHRQAFVKVRIGQPAFRAGLLRTLGSVCAITGAAPAAALEACHLYSYAQLAEHHVHGGLLLRRDIHRLFDLGLLVVDPASLTVDVDRSLEQFPEYANLAGRPLAVNPSAGQLRWLKNHWRQHRLTGV